ncbi:molybdenum cofactor sulfurase-like [Lycium ferocissimum]|uniref:molybdenum cofactor sulfurase-like n=1 Tax=Lycium ferocissimum TaxID=112874 RepID=UPI002814ACB9|nr:molybdenum cofactor sulfurase-like [Lycium ferocissimum]
MQSPCFKCICCQNSYRESNPTSKISIIITCHREFIDAMASSIQPNSQFTNHECLPSCLELFSNLKEAYPHYCQTNVADEIRAHEYYHLSLSKHVCLDYIGNGLFSYYQQHGHHHPADDSIASSSSAPPPPTQQFASPNEPFFNISYKSVNLSTQLLYRGQESDLECNMRKRIMKYMNISKSDYSMVFTANQSSAFKLLADSYPFESNHNLVTVYDYENEAVEGMIDSAKKKGARVVSAELSWPNLRINSRKLRKMLVAKKNGNKKRGLFVFPLQSKVTGTKYSYQWMNIAQENGWHVLFDASALGPKDMETLGLSIFQPDFLICSFYKVFGENPSGFCCLFVKNSSISQLNKCSTSLGIISLVPVAKSFEDKDDFASSSSTSSESDQEFKQVSDQEPEKITTLFEILNWGNKSNKNRWKKVEFETSMSSDELECRGLDHADKLGLILTSSRARYLINWLINALTRLQHPHAEDIHHPLVKIYGPKIHFNRGQAVAFNVFDWKGQKIDPTLVQKLADRNNISISCAFLQHIWFSKMYDDEKKTILETFRSGDNIKRGKLNSGVLVITVSIGMMTNFEDLYRLWSFIARFLDADFVEKERWRYKALNQTTIEV